MLRGTLTTLNLDRIRPGDNIPSGSVQHIDEINESRRFIKVGCVIIKIAGNAAVANYVASLQIQCFPLFTMVAAVGNTTVVDYLSLDIEGAELAVLKYISFTTVCPTILLNHSIRILGAFRGTTLCAWA